MKKVLSVFGTLCAIAAFFLGEMVIVSHGMLAVSQKNDVSVVWGVFLLIVAVTFLYVGGSMVIGLVKKHFSKIGAALGVIILASMVNGCTRIGVGHEGIVVNLAGSARGVDSSAITTGWVLYNPLSTRVLEYPTYVQTAVWTNEEGEGRLNKNDEITFNSKEGMLVKANISLSYQINPRYIPAFYNRFLTDDLDQFTHGYLRNIARDAFTDIAPRFTTEEIYSTAKDTILNMVKARINAQVQDIGLVIEQFGFIGAPTLPEQVVAALNAKITAMQTAQKAQNEVALAQAEAQKTIATAHGEALAAIERARGEAEANRIVNQSITQNLLAWRDRKNVSDAIQKWDGVRPQVEGVGSGGLLLNIAPNRGSQARQ